MKAPKIFREAMERHKRPESWAVGMALTMLFLYFLWTNDIYSASAFFVLTFILPFVFPKPKKKIKFIEDVAEWELTWGDMPPYSKIFNWAVEAAGFGMMVYGLWIHDLQLVAGGVLVIIWGLVDFVARFGFKKRR